MAYKPNYSKKGEVTFKILFSIPNKSRDTEHYCLVLKLCRSIVIFFDYCFGCYQFCQALVFFFRLLANDKI